jgi:hypothetical protein
MTNNKTTTTTTKQQTKHSTYKTTTHNKTKQHITNLAILPIFPPTLEQHCKSDCSKQQTDALEKETKKK